MFFAGADEGAAGAALVAAGARPRAGSRKSRPLASSLAPLVVGMLAREAAPGAVEAS